MSNFKLIFIGVFVAAAVFGVLVFAGIVNIGGSSTTTTDIKGAVTVWGPFENRSIIGFFTEYNTQNPNVTVTYVAKDPATFDQALVEAMATGTAPDLVLLPDSLAWRFRDKLTHIPFTSLPVQTLQSTFASSANVFSVSDGTLAIPWTSDPLVMYYNRDMLESVGVVQPPKRHIHGMQGSRLIGMHSCRAILPTILERQAICRSCAPKILI